ncbi:MAG: diguanylate cyclase [Planctomycetota bacterium]
MTWYFGLAGAINIAIGFALALYLRRRYWMLVSAAEWRATNTATGARPGPSIADVPAREVNASARNATTLDELLGSAAAPVTRTSPEQQEPDRERSPAEACLTDLRDEVGRYQDVLIAADDRLRTAHSGEAVADCLTAVSEAAEQYQQRRGTIVTSLDQLLEAVSVPATAVEKAVAAEDAQIEAARQRFEQFDPEGDLPAEMRQIVAEINRMVQASDEVRESVDGIDAELAQQEGRLAAHLDESAAAGRPNPAALSETILQWWNKDPHRLRRLTLAVLDMDQLGQINQRFGHRTGDQIIEQAARFFAPKKHDEYSLTHYSGQRFVVLLPDGDIRLAISTVERLRQGLEMCRFHQGDQVIQATVSCGVTEAVPADSLEGLLARAESTLREAKRFGRNRTFVHEGKFPAPVVPPNLTLDERHVDL